MANIRELVKFDDVKHITAKEYFTGEEFAADMFDAKYAHQLDFNWDTTPFIRRETPAEVFLRVASGLAVFEKEEHREYYTNIWFSLMWNGWYRPGGSIMAGVGSKVRQSLFNCNTIPLEGDSIEAIAKCDYSVMKCAAFRQGLGIDASVLRPRNASVNNAAIQSTGTIPWVEKIVDNGKYVGQQGRMPALLISLKDHHPDIFEFVKAKIEAGKIENANISVQISNAFMEAVKVDADWELYFEFENNAYERISKTIKARELFEVIAATAYKSAEPGVQFIDQLRKGSMVHQIFESTGDKRFQIISTNACCFVDTTLVHTNKGILTIAEIRDKLKEGEEIEALSFNIENEKQEYKPIVDCFSREEGTPQQTVTIELENGKCIECTPDHKFLTNRGWVEAKNLSNDDDILEV